ncbi:MAG: lamin tail domain-containing protein, partial [Planctomycetes bacterium]|nr:lamin tail domain-containing protein [Planctomycetota bacterium]
AIRGRSIYTNRWTLVTIEGTEAVTPAHSSGVGVIVLSDTQVALWTGQNNTSSQGFVARWTDIDPGADGEFSIVCRQYKGSTPGVGSGTADGSKGYSITAVRLAEVAPAGPQSWLKRTGSTDGDTAADFARSTAGSKGDENDGLTVPFGTIVPAEGGIGFAGGDAQYETLIHTDVRDQVQHVNSSLWTRIAFDGAGLADLDSMTLRMQYDDGFRAYLNGTLVASRNAGPTPAWDEAATAERDNAEAVQFEDIDISSRLGQLRNSTNVLAIQALNYSADDGDLLLRSELAVSGTSYDDRPKYFLTPTPGTDNGTGQEAYPGVRINEIHSDPDVKTELVEFVELYNGSPQAVDLGGWYFDRGISYTFPAGASIAPGGYVVVAQDPGQFQAKFGFSPYGPWTGKLANDGEEIVLRNSSFQVADRVEYGLTFPWPTVGDSPGRSMELISPALDNDLGGSWRSGGPTPGAQNSVFADNAPPQLRQVSHSPKQPAGGEPVTITVKATDPDGVAAVTLQYQVVEPGNYIEYDEPAYQTNWTNLPMRDDGTGGDDQAGDDVYTAVLPGSVQIHRRLIRYRIVAVDASPDALSVTVPYPDDPGRNFAYFVYDGVPSWHGAIDPNSSDPAKSEVVEYTPDVLDQVPVYQLITKHKSHVDAMHIPDSTTNGYTGSDYPWIGTFVYDGEVYDHIHYRARGGVWRYAMGKNMWKFDFNRGHPFQARDDWGRKYKTSWDKVNFSACIQQGNYLHRGEQGMFEAAGFKMFNLVGVEAPKTHWVQFRIVEDADEFGPTQYDDDFQGLYLVIEQVDGNFLDEHDLPDGNLYKIEHHNGTLNNQGPTAVTDKSDLAAFKQGYYYDPDPTVQWWRDNVDLQKYYSYRAIVEMIHHGDIGYGK